jgi:hypothetical protein
VANEKRSYVVTRSARVDAPPARVYQLIADYRNGHPTILPRAFSDLTVVKGGVGAGTEIRFNLRVLGRLTRFHAVVSEPEPGRLLVERNLEPEASTTRFIVDPIDGGRASEVTISTELEHHGGPVGAIRKWLTRRVLDPLYVEELRLIADRATLPAGAARNGPAARRD